MTHRVALVLSIVLTLVVGAGVVAGRDRLFAPESAVSAGTATTAAAKSPDDTQAGQLTRTSPRVVTVTLPPSLNTSGESSQERSERSVDRERDDQGRGDDERYEHSGEYEDD
ncbi:MAG: hypothetical protein U0075_00865 [Thermomicrobiales bacterium]